MNKLILLGLALVLALACRREVQDDWRDTNLLAYGLPVTILAPDSAVIQRQDWGTMVQDVTVRHGNDYDVQIYAYDAETNDIAKIKADQIAEVKSNRFFSRIIREEEPGFIYETRMDSSNVHYGFRYIHLQGDKEYIFQNGLSSLFALEEVERMYEAVKPRKTR